MKKILVVDDYDSIRKGIKILFESTGKFEVYEAANGNLALAVLSQKEPDVAIVDLMMPEMDGFTLCNEIKKKYPKVPVIILTARADPLTEEKVKLENKPDKYLTKPIENQKLIDTVDEVLSK